MSTTPVKWKFSKERNEYATSIGNLEAFITTGMGSARRCTRYWRWMIKSPLFFTAIGHKYHKKPETAKKEAEGILARLQ